VLIWVCTVTSLWIAYLDYLEPTAYIFKKIQLQEGKAHYRDCFNRIHQGAAL